LITLWRHRLVGGFSPVATRQMPEAARRAIIVAAAPIAPYKPIQSALRSMGGTLPRAGFGKPGAA